MADQIQTIEIRDTAAHEGQVQDFLKNSAGILKVVNGLNEDVSIEIETNTFDDPTFTEAVSFTTKLVAAGVTEYISVVGAWKYTRMIATAALTPATGSLKLVWEFKKDPIDPDTLTTGSIGVPGGICPLDLSNYVPLVHLPPAVLDHMDFKGPWDASGGTMPVSPDNGDTYRISVPGTLPVVGYAEIGDLLIYSTDDGGWTLYQTNMTIGDGVDEVQQNGAALNASEIVETDGAKKFITAAKNTAYNKAFGFIAGAVPAISGTWVGSKIIETDGIGKKLIEVAKRTAYNQDFGTGAADVCEGNDARLSDTRNIAVYRQAAEPTLGADDDIAIWVDTDDSNKTYLVFRVASGTQVKVVMT